MDMNHDIAHMNVHLVSMNNNPVLHNLGSIVLCLMSAEKQTSHLLVIVSGGSNDNEMRTSVPAPYPNQDLIYIP